MRSRRLIMVLALAILLALCPSCARSSGGMRDGYYTAEGAEFNEYAWKEYLTIYVSMGKILTVEYDAYNVSGFVRSWDLKYMRTMNRISGTYPNQFTRKYSVELLGEQDTDAVDAISGATDSYASFMLLAEAVIEQAKKGDPTVVLVDLSEKNTVTDG